MDYILISASDINHSPYLQSYINFFKKNNIKYKIIKWNKYGNETQGIDEESFNLQYDIKSNLLIKFFVYIRYLFFVLYEVKKFPNSKLIVFTIPLITFLSPYLFLFKKKEFFLDIRDYNKIYFNYLFRCLYKKCCGIFVSSMGFKNWLKLNDYSKVLVSHNVTTSIYKMSQFNENSRKVLTIGSIRDYFETSFVIDILSNYRFEIVGDGIVLNELKSRCENIDRVIFTGAYLKINEYKFLKDTSFINSTLDKTFNNKFILTNRLYLGVQNYIPLISNRGNYQSEIIDKYDLGIVYTDVNDIPKLIKEFYNKYTFESFKKNCDFFLDLIEIDNNKLYKILTYYANHKK